MNGVGMLQQLLIISVLLQRLTVAAKRRSVLINQATVSLCLHAINCFTHQCTIHYYIDCHIICFHVQNTIANYKQRPAILRISATLSEIRVSVCL